MQVAVCHAYHFAVGEHIHQVLCLPQLILCHGYLVLDSRPLLCQFFDIFL